MLWFGLTVVGWYGRRWQMQTTRIPGLWPGLLSGAAAGAAGTTALNVITYLDIVVRGRPTSTTPERTVEAMARLFGVTVPGTGDVLANRLVGLGALTGYAAGIGMGLILGLADALGWRPGLLVATLVATVIALIGTNGPMTAGGDRPADVGCHRVGQRSDSALRIRGGHRVGAALPVSRAGLIVVGIGSGARGFHLPDDRCKAQRPQEGIRE